jgi:hypothetical protein
MIIAHPTQFNPLFLLQANFWQNLLPTVYQRQMTNLAQMVDPNLLARLADAPWLKASDLFQPTRQSHIRPVLYLIETVFQFIAIQYPLTKRSVII